MVPPVEGEEQPAAASSGQWALWMLALWAGTLGLMLLGLYVAGDTLSDLQAYLTAAEAVADGRSPWRPTPEHTLDEWRALHDFWVTWDGGFGPPPPGPYLYPPSLALLMAQTGCPEALALVIIAAVPACFGWLWVRMSDADPRWVLLIILSWDVLGTLMGGNIELLCLLGLLFSAWLYWRDQAVATGLIAALILLVKPFFVVFFLAFAVLAMRPSAGRSWSAPLRAALAGSAVIAVEVWRWPPWLRTETWEYATHGLARTYYALPADLSMPMSAMNRAPMQVFVGWGLDARSAGLVALGLCAVAVVLARWRLHRDAPFAAVFSLSWVLLLIARPISFALPLLELVVLSVAWPSLGPRSRRAVLGVTVALMLSRWLAMIFGVTGVMPTNLTLQTTTLPWETLLVLPGALLLALLAAAHPPSVHSTGPPPETA